MSKVLRTRRLPWPSGLIMAGAPPRQLRLPPCPEFPVSQVAGGGTGQVSGALLALGESDDGQGCPSYERDSHLKNDV
ncbi:MAG: hypothetical protein WCO86_10070 [Planctomycetota bacterium]